MNSGGVCLIVGASHAGAQLAAALRQEGWKGDIVLIGDEAYLPYNRPPLSKNFLRGELSAEDLLIRHAAAYARADIRCQLQSRVTAIDRQRKTLQLDTGSSLAYDKLALTCGARVRRLDLPGAELERIFYLRTIADVDAIRGSLGADSSVVVVGGGYIGLETAAMLRTLGHEVTVLEMAPRVLSRVAAPEISSFYQRVHQEEGVRVLTDVALEGFEGEQAVSAVLTTDGERFEADLVIVGIGIEPETGLAESAGLEVNDGIVVDQYGVTSDPDIVAAGDCTRFFSSFYQRDMRLESVQNAVDQAQAAAATLCGKDKPYKALPWFWSDQYDTKLQIAGLSEGYDELILRGDSEAGRKFAGFYFREGALIAVDAVNDPQAFMIGKRSMTADLALDRTRISDTAIPMRDLLPAS